MLRLEHRNLTLVQDLGTHAHVQGLRETRLMREQPDGRD